MNDIQKALIELSSRKDISSMGLRAIARELGVKNPQTVKYHLQKIAVNQGLIERSAVQIEKNKLGSSDLIRIPVKGFVSAGPATQIANDETGGYLRVSSNLLKSRNYKDLYALIVSGLSMNNANVHGNEIDDGDFVIIDSSKRSPRNGEYVIAQVDNLANIKKLHIDKGNKQVILLSESSEKYEPIFVHPDDNHENLIMGTVVQVMRQPKFSA